MAEEPGQEHKDSPSDVDKLPRGRLIGFAIVGAIVVVVILLVWVKPSDPTEKKDFIQAVGVLLAALAGLGGLYFTRENTEKQLRQARESQQQTQRLTEQGQITERFTRAIDQLGATHDNGDKKLEIRLGGIYALERIDKESPKRAYHGTVMEVLTAYVRENSRRDSGKSSTPTLAAQEAAEQQDKEGVEQDAELTIHNPSAADIQVILDVLKRREEERVPEKHRVHLDLRGAYLGGANLQGANLQGTFLEDTNLQAANLQGAQLGGANLQRASLVVANLQGARLYDGANLQGARLESANLRGASLQNANLQAASLVAANLRGASLEDANLQAANFLHAEVTAEQLADTLSLQGATMPGGSEHP